MYRDPHNSTSLIIHPKLLLILFASNVEILYFRALFDEGIGADTLHRMSV